MILGQSWKMATLKDGTLHSKSWQMVLLNAVISLIDGDTLW